MSREVASQMVELPLFTPAGPRLYRRPITYPPWVRWMELVADPGAGGPCADYSVAMALCLPELRVAAGLFVEEDGLLGTPCAHWWCMADGATILDPTWAQFEEGHYHVEGIYDAYEAIEVLRRLKDPVVVRHILRHAVEVMPEVMPRVWAHCM